MSQTARKIEYLDIRLVEKAAARVAKAFEEARKTKKENKRRRKTGGRSAGSLSLVVKNNKWVTRAIKKERDSRNILGRMQPEQWRERIESLEEPLRTKMCFLVWWDFFGSRRVTRRWPQLDHILANHEILVGNSCLNRDKLVLALCNIGYTPYEATKRISESMDDE